MLTKREQLAIAMGLMPTPIVKVDAVLHDVIEFASKMDVQGYDVNDATIVVTDEKDTVIGEVIGMSYSMPDKVFKFKVKLWL